jgi:SAM-dependent methyltransferase
MTAGPCPETRFGTWFISSWVWTEYVVRDTVADLVRLLGPRTVQRPVILEVGCGVGSALTMLDEAFEPAVLIGRDLDLKLLRRADREATARCRCRVDFAAATATRLDLRDAAVDMILCHQTLHHLEEPEAAAREFHRVLRPGGALLVAESCAPFTASLRVRLLFRHPMHVQRLAAEWVDLVRATGFVIDPECVVTPYPWWSRPDFGLFEWLGRPVPARRDETVVHLAAFKP